MIKPIWQSLLLVSLLLLGGCREEIIHDLDELRANQVQLLLSSAGIPAKKQRSGTHWLITVPREQVEVALRAVEQSRLLRRELARSVEESKGLLESKEERSAHAERRLAMGLEQTLERIPGVLESRVHLHIREVSPFETAVKSTASSASVLLVVMNSKDIETAHVTKIVSGAVGLKSEDVSVVVSALANEEPQTNHVTSNTGRTVSTRAAAAPEQLSPPTGTKGLLMSSLLALGIVLVLLLIFCRLRRQRGLLAVLGNEPESRPSAESMN